MISYVIRKDPYGFPPRDNTILMFMQSEPSDHEKVLMSSPNPKPDLTTGDRDERISNIWFHAIAVGILRASFEIYNGYISSWRQSLPFFPTQLDQLAAVSHEKMAPIHGGRSPFRVEFCGRVDERARKIAAACIRDQAFRACFDDTKLSGIRSALNSSNCTAMKKLRSALSKLERILGQFSRTCTKDPLLVMVFDEVSSLLDKDGRGGPYVALNRLISCISKDHHVWYFFSVY
ncbi:hypothetical protein VTN77DRAFT_6911 [Rasamsonia byssochlamydoides]|uniref:uncharacterized protein n=1 Tax=Rasamsonia byssochlamydoides TaxID=89139 RepID=UPI003741E90D